MVAKTTRKKSTGKTSKASTSKKAVAKTEEAPIEVKKAVNAKAPAKKNASKTSAKKKTVATTEKTVTTSKKVSPAKAAPKKSPTKASPKKKMVKASDDAPLGNKKLIIVESPSKAKTIDKILGRSYKVMASVGHIRDLPKSRLGVNVENNFEPTYSIMTDKKEIVSQLKEEAKTASEIYLAPDPDREGEAIAWHLWHILQPSARAKFKPAIRRVEFHEITPNAVKKAMESPKEIDQDRVDAQQARRIVDRLVGYKLSPLLSLNPTVLEKSSRTHLSAGRVQSVALRILCERDLEIKSFVPQEYWKVWVEFKRQRATFAAQLARIGKKKAEIGNEAACQEITHHLEKATFTVTSVKTSEQLHQPPMPFITSTLQQEASRKHGFGVKRTMQLAQQLYEGLDIDGQGPIGLISYMRTDSVRVSNDAQQAARTFIAKQYGKTFLPATPRQTKAKAGAQDAHEAIRPTDPNRTPELLKSALPPELFKLYKLIWSRFIASQMTPARSDVVAVEIMADDKYLLRARHTQLVFAGYQQVYIESQEDEEEKESKGHGQLVELKEGENLKKENILPSQHFTIPPPLFSEASLVKALEEKRIGRPSTYAPTISTLLDREYTIKENKNLFPTDLGHEVNKLLLQYFPDVVDVGFTATMEEQLDDVANGQKDWHEILASFYGPFAATLAYAQEEIHKLQLENAEACDLCGKPMLIKNGRFGPFMACSGYPDCTNKKKIGKAAQEEPRESGESCEVCGKPMLIKKGRFGDFLACSGYPECTQKKPLLKDIGVPCPEPKCQGKVVQRRSKKGKVFYGCSEYPTCKFVSWYEPTEQPCPDCKSYMLKKFSKAKGEYLQCSSLTCKKVEQVANS